MSREVLKKAHGPYELEPQQNTVSICMCGLSKNQPFCDGSHKITLDEVDGEIYQYDENNKRVEESGCCGGGCCSSQANECCGKKCDDLECCNDSCDCNSEE